jgi:hypothetical protein
MRRSTHLPISQKKAMTATTKPAKVQPASAANLEPQEISGEVLLEKYAKGNEQNVADVRLRVARALAAMESEDKRAVLGEPSSSKPRSAVSSLPAASTLPRAPIWPPP